MTDGLAPPSWAQRARELRLPLDVVRLLAATPGLRSSPPGDGRPVILVAGFGATDASLLPLRTFLGHLGHHVRPAGLGRVSDDVEGLVARLLVRAAAVADETGSTPALVGWSIGGVLARESARERPDLVRRVVTFGTPVEGGPSYTALADRYDPAALADVRARIAERLGTPITVPITAIWSPNDGIVSAAACIDHHSPDVEHVQVSGTHAGMGVDPDVWRVVADRLAREV